MVCGLENSLGLKAAFYELENGELAAIFIPADQHQSYPGILHGGMISAILDEVIGRAFMLQSSDSMGMTIELKVTYLKPVPLNEEMKVFGRITHEDAKIFEGTSEIILAVGKIAARGHAKFMKLPFDKVSPDFRALEWKVTQSATDPTEIERR